MRVRPERPIPTHEDIFMRFTRACLTCVLRTGGLRERRTIDRITSASDLVRWSSAAQPGDVAEYHRGYLLCDLAPALPADAAHHALAELAACARQLADDGALHLVQARVEVGAFRYLAVAASPAGRSPAR